MLRFTAFFALLAAAASAHAQSASEDTSTTPESGWSGQVALVGFGVRPTYRGSDGIGASWFPSETLFKSVINEEGDTIQNVDVFGIATHILNDAKYKDIFFFDTVRRDFGVNWLDYEFEESGRTTAALIGHYENRRLTVEDKTLVGLEELSRAVFVGGRFTHEYDAFRVDAAIAVDVTGQASGAIRGDATLTYDWSPAERWRLRPYVGLELGDGAYNDTYFGVSATEATASQASGVGLSAYNAPAGLTAFSTGVRADFDITERFGLMGLARFERLAPAAADSSLVSDFGSPNQFSAGIALTFKY